MMKYVVFYKLKKKKGMTSESIKNHVEFLRNLSRDKALFLCGLLKGYGAMLILEAKSQKEAESFIKQDPLIVQENYEYKIHEFKEANEANNFLL